MVKGLYTSFTGMVNEQKRMDTLANNLANSATTGFKKEGMTAQSFDSALALKIKDTSVGGAVQQIGDLTLGVKVGETYTDWSQGSFKYTEKETDLALAGKGFFAIEFTNKAGQKEIMYTRDGSFSVTTDGYLVTGDGDYVLNQKGALNSTIGQNSYIKIDPNISFEVDEQGNIYQNRQLVAQIGVVDIEDYNYISKYGENLYGLVQGGRVIEGDALVEQGCLEASNVNVVDEMVNMIAIQRAYQAGQKVMQTIDSTLDKAVNDVGRV